MEKVADIIIRTTPEWLRTKLKRWSSFRYFIALFSYLIAPFYGYLMLPRLDGTAKIYGEKLDFFVHPDTSAIDSLIEIYRENVYERLRNIKEGDIVIDVGANVGMFTVKAAKKVGDNGLVIAIEPYSQNVKLLKRNIEKYALNNVIIIPYAVSSSSGKAKLYVHPVSSACKLASEDELESLQKTENVTVTTLDEVVEKFNINRVDFLKIDVEGSELDALNGAQKCLNLVKSLVIECHSSIKKKEVKRFLEERGFKCHIDGNICYAYS